MTKQVFVHHSKAFISPEADGPKADAPEADSREVDVHCKMYKRCKAAREWLNIPEHISPQEVHSVGRAGAN